MLRNLSSIQAWFIALMLGMVVTSCAPPSPVIKVDSSTTPFHVHDKVSVPIKVENVANLTAIELHLSFDPQVLEVISINDGGFLKANFPVQNTFDNTAGTVDYAAAQINGIPANGSGTLLEVVFRARASGDASIRLRGTQAAPIGLLLSDSNGATIKALFIDGRVNIQ